MPTLAQFLLTIAGSLAARVLTALGFAIASYQGITTLADNAIKSAQSSFNLIPPEILAIMNIAGAGQVLGILAAAITTRASMNGFKKFVLK